MNWENEIFEPKIGQLIELADIFDVSVDYLIERKFNNDQIDTLCKELEKISGKEFIEFIKCKLKN